MKWKIQQRRPSEILYQARKGKYFSFKIKAAGLLRGIHALGFCMSAKVEWCNFHHCRRSTRVCAAPLWHPCADQKFMWMLHTAKAPTAHVPQCLETVSVRGQNADLLFEIWIGMHTHPSSMSTYAWGYAQSIRGVHTVCTAPFPVWNQILNWAYFSKN